MRTVSWVLVVAFVVGSAAPVLARRPRCDELVAGLTAGRTAEELAAEFNTTRVRVEACMRIAEARERQDTKRAEFHLTRQERGLDH